MTCQQCAKGDTPVKRFDTGEWIHNARVMVGKVERFTHVVCTDKPRWSK